MVNPAYASPDSFYSDFSLFLAIYFTTYRATLYAH